MRNQNQTKRNKAKPNQQADNERVPFSARDGIALASEILLLHHADVCLFLI